MRARGEFRDPSLRIAWAALLAAAAAAAWRVGDDSRSTIAGYGVRNPAQQDLQNLSAAGGIGDADFDLAGSVRRKRGAGEFRAATRVDQASTERGVRVRRGAGSIKMADIGKPVSCDCRRLQIAVLRLNRALRKNRIWSISVVRADGLKRSRQETTGTRCRETPVHVAARLGTEKPQPTARKQRLPNEFCERMGDLLLLARTKQATCSAP